MGLEHVGSLHVYAGILFLYLVFLVNHRNEKLFTTAKTYGANGLMDSGLEPDPRKIEKDLVNRLGKSA